MVEIRISNINGLILPPAPDGCSVRLAVNPADNGMAFDSPFSDYILSCLSDVSVKGIIEYTLLLLHLQKDDMGTRSVHIEKIEINVNALSEEEIRRKVDEAIKEKIDSTISESEKNQ